MTMIGGYRAGGHDARMGGRGSLPALVGKMSRAHPSSISLRRSAGWETRGMRIFAIAAALAAAGIWASAAPANAPPRLPDADPAIWVVNDHDTTIYLFGTFHALDGKSAWFNDEVRTAFAASDELVLETVIPERHAIAEPRPT